MGPSLVDPTEFRSFCFRGEGRANFVISAKNDKTGLRIVWRFAKQRKSGFLTVKAKSEMVNSYMSRLITPFFSPNYLVSPKMVQFRIEDVHHLAKVPSLPANLKIENFEDLKSLPEKWSFLPIDSIPKGVTRLTGLEMLDATRIPKQFTVFVGSTITVEIKPKQGYYQDHPGFNLQHCNNCVLQIEKCSSDAFKHMYDFCPMDLYSGNLERMRSSIEALLKVPHRNLRLFVDGNLVHSEESPLEWNSLNCTLFPDRSASTNELVDALCCILAGQSSIDSANFYLSPSSVLNQILSGQKVDTIGISKAHEIFKELPPKAQDELSNKSALLKKTLGALQDGSRRSLLERYLLAATMKDCSVMTSIRLLPNDEVERARETHDIDETYPENPKQMGIVRIGDLHFAYSVKIVDLDPKSAKNLVNAYSRFESGASILQNNNSIRKPCFVKDE